MSRFARTRGFTLTDVLISGAILATLTTVAVPRYLCRLDRAKDAELSGIFDGLRTAQSVYYQFNEEYAADFAAISFRIEGRSPPQAGTGEVWGKYFAYEMEPLMHGGGRQIGWLVTTQCLDRTGAKTASDGCRNCRWALQQEGELPAELFLISDATGPSAPDGSGEDEQGQGQGQGRGRGRERGDGEPGSNCDIDPWPYINAMCPPADPWSSHGGYVSCVSEATNQLKKMGCLTGREKGEIMKTVAQTEIGKDGAGDTNGNGQGNGNGGGGGGGSSEGSSGGGNGNSGGGGGGGNSGH